ncbi:MAG TPA: hypothetical protein VKS81_00800 [Bacteroidota bacterium]|nr:hypothetical protein [Bacteroidota bacterium]
MFLFNAVPSRAQNATDSVHKFLRASFKFSDSELAAIDSGKVVAKVLPADNPAEVAVCGAAHLTIPASFATEQYGKMESFETGSDMEEIGRFGSPAKVKDLDGLTLEEDDISALRDCSPGHCDIKLSADAMKRFRSEISWDAPDYRNKVLALMKVVLVGYVQSYRIGGTDSMREYDDQSYKLDRGAEFRKFLHESPSLISAEPKLVSYLDRAPQDTGSSRSEYTFWEKEDLPNVKPVLGLYHAIAYRSKVDANRTFLISKQIYANHFFEGSLTQMELIRDNGPRHGFYALYLRRATIDNLRHHGFLDFSGKIRDALFELIHSQMVWMKNRVETLYKKSAK